MEVGVEDGEEAAAGDEEQGGQPEERVHEELLAGDVVDDEQQEEAARHGADAHGDEGLRGRGAEGVVDARLGVRGVGVPGGHGGQGRTRGVEGPDLGQRGRFTQAQAVESAGWD